MAAPSFTVILLFILCWMKFMQFSFPREGVKRKLFSEFVHIQVFAIFVIERWFTGFQFTSLIALQVFFTYILVLSEEIWDLHDFSECNWFVFPVGLLKNSDFILKGNAFYRTSLCSLLGVGILWYVVVSLSRWGWITFYFR